MKRTILLFLAAVMLGSIFVGVAMAADTQKMQWTGVNYTKFLWGNRRYDGSMYNFTTIPGEGYGDNGQGTEFELLVHSKPSSKIEVNARLKSRFNQNQWTNWGGFGGNPNADGVDGDRGEFDPRSNQYVKLRGITVNITPGYGWLNRATIGSSDFGMFDAFTIGKIRYIDRDNGKGLFFNGSFLDGKLSYDAARISLSRLWSGPYYRTFPSGDEDVGTDGYKAMDAVYGVQAKFRPLRNLGVTGIWNFLNDLEIDPNDDNLNNGTDVRDRQRNIVYGLKADWSPTPDLNLNGAGYYSIYRTYEPLGTAGWSSYSAYNLGNLDDYSYTVDVDWDILGSGVNLGLQYFNIGSDYVSVMAARRESDVLITEGSEGTWYYPEADNASWRGTSVLGYGGFLGHAQQVATTNVDNEFTDFDEPLAESVIGWKGITAAPAFALGDVDIAGEFSYIDYNTNWQMWGRDQSLGNAAEGDMNVNFFDSPYVMAEPDAGFGTFRSPYMPFQEKTTYIYMVKADYFLDIGAGVDLHAKWKFIDEEDLRINDETYVPYNPDGTINNAETQAQYGEVAGAKLFDSLGDDDKSLELMLWEIGAGYQLTSELYADLTYQYYDVDLVDGTTAFMGNRSHRMAGGKHKKNAVTIDASYMVGGAEFGMIYEWSFGEWAPDFGSGYDVVTNADGDRGFINNWGGFESVEKRKYTHGRMKAFMKVLF